MNRRHIPGAVCKICCCGGPYKCSEPECKGFVHRAVYDEVEVGDGEWEWCHDFKCDMCAYEINSSGEQYVEFEHMPQAEESE